MHPYNVLLICLNVKRAGRMGRTDTSPRDIITSNLIIVGAQIGKKLSTCLFFSPSPGEKRRRRCAIHGGLFSAQPTEVAATLLGELRSRDKHKRDRGMKIGLGSIVSIFLRTNVWQTLMVCFPWLVETRGADWRQDDLQAAVKHSNLSAGFMGAMKETCPSLKFFLLGGEMKTLLPFI